jgi:hypothetical protein
MVWVLAGGWFEDVGDSIVMKIAAFCLGRWPVRLYRQMSAIVRMPYSTEQFLGCDFDPFPVPKEAEYSNCQRFMT